MDGGTIPELAARGAYQPGPPQAPPTLLPTTDLGLTAMGMVTAVGIDAAQTFDSVRARIIRAAENEDIYRCRPPDPDFEMRSPAVMAAITYLGHDHVRERDPALWFARMATCALTELHDDSRLAENLAAKAGLFVALPASRPDWGVGSVGRFLNSLLRDAATGPFHTMRVALGGRATALALFAEAAVAVSAQRIDSAVILGVDSYLRTSWLAELDQAYMLKSERNFDGFVPAEAAACVLLEPAARAAQRQSRVWATVKAVAHEPYAGADSDNTGEVLARVASACLPPAASSPLVVTDLNGTTSKAREWGFALSRLGDRLANPQVEYPVVSLGDVGAASGVVLALFAAMSLADEHTNLEHVLVCAASDAESAGGGDSLRASLLLGKPAAAPAVVQRPAEDGEARERTFAWLQVPSSTT